MVLALNIGLTVVQAEVIQSTVVLLVVTGAYTLGSFCDSILARCTQNAMVSGFDIVTHDVVNGDELVGVGADYSADIFTNNGGVPGTPLGIWLYRVLRSSPSLGATPASIRWEPSQRI